MKKQVLTIIAVIVLAGCGTAQPANADGANQRRKPARSFFISGRVVDYDLPSTPEGWTAVKLRLEESAPISVYRSYLTVRVGDYWWRGFNKFPPGERVVLRVREAFPGNAYFYCELDEVLDKMPRHADPEPAPPLTDEEKTGVLAAFSRSTGPGIPNPEMLGKYGRSLVEVVRGSLGSRDEATRMGALLTASLVSDVSYIPELKKLSKSRSTRLRTACMAAAREMGTEEALGILKQGMLDEDEGVRIFAFTGIGWLHKPDTLPLLEVGLADVSAAIRRRAARMIAMLGTPRAAGAL